MKFFALASLVYSAPVDNESNILPVIIGGTEVFIFFVEKCAIIKSF